MLDVLTVAFLLLAGHAVADFALQGPHIATGKNRHRKTEPPPGQTYTPCWSYFLTAHVLIHGLAVYLATGAIVLGLLETVFHWWIDFFKCENVYGVHTDQFLHLFCKLVWLFVWTQL